MASEEPEERLCESLRIHVPLTAERTSLVDEQLLWLSQNQLKLIERGLPTGVIVEYLKWEGLLFDHQREYRDAVDGRLAQEDRVRRLIAFLTSSDQRTLQAFSLAVTLRAGHLGLPTPWFSWWRVHGVQHVRERLCLRYRERGKMFRLTDWNAYETGDRSSAWELDDIVCNVALMAQKELEFLHDSVPESNLLSSHADHRRMEYLRRQETKGVFLHLDKIFPCKPQDQPGSRLGSLCCQQRCKVVVGPAGAGKSVLFTIKAPFNWTERSMWPQFTLVFVLLLSNEDVWKATTVRKLFALDTYGQDERGTEEVVSFITENSHRVLVICDGLDEIPSDVDIEGSLLWKIITAAYPGLPRVHILLTSRPCQPLRLLVNSNTFSQRLEVIGFTWNDVTSFVRRYFTCEEIVADQLLKELDSRPELALMARLPLLLVLICNIFRRSLGHGTSGRTDLQLPGSMTQIYVKIILAFLHRADSKRRSTSSLHNIFVPEGEFDSFSSLSSKWLNVLDELSCLALSGYIENKGVFSAAEVMGISNNAHTVGILQSNRAHPESGGTRFSFQHLTFLEFLAAYRLFRLVTSAQSSLDQATILEDHFRRVQVVSARRTFWKYVASLLPHDLLTVFMDGLKNEMRLTKSCHNAEGGQRSPDQLQHDDDKVLLLECCLDLLSSDSCIRSASSLSSNTAAMLLYDELGASIVLKSRQMRPSTCLSLGHYIRTHASIISSVNLNECIIGTQGIACLLVGLQVAANLLHLSFTSNRLTQSALRLLLPALAGLHKLQTLELRGNPLEHDGAFAAVQMAIEHPSLSTIGISNCDLSLSCIDRLKKLAEKKSLDIVTHGPVPLPALSNK